MEVPVLKQGDSWASGLSVFEAELEETSEVERSGPAIAIHLEIEVAEDSQAAAEALEQELGHRDTLWQLFSL